MRRTLVSLFTMKEAAERYVDYLRFADKELPALPELFPKSSDMGSDVVRFHTQLCEEMEKNDFHFKGIKVISANHDAARVLRAPGPLCVPVFDSFFDEDVFPVRQFRLQHVEAAICFTIGEDVDAHAVPGPEYFSPAVEVTGTRYPFYPPTVSGFACDLCSCVRVATGTKTRFSKENATALSSYSFVLVKDQEPVEVGGGKAFQDDPLKAISYAAEYAKALGKTLKQNDVVLCSGLTQRVAAHPGSYTLQWGAYGDAKCTII